MSSGNRTPRSSSIRPPTCAATAKPMNQYMRYRPALLADCPRLICAYSLAKKKNGMKTIDIKPSAAVSRANIRLRKIDRSSSGVFARSSQRMKATISDHPAATVTQVAGSLHPQVEDCCRPSTISASAAVTRTAPVRSIGAGRRVSSGRERQGRARATTAGGTLIQKIERHVHWVRNPPDVALDL